jgi:hypothetical protein
MNKLTLSKRILLMIVAIPIVLAVVLTVYAARQVTKSKELIHESLAQTTSKEMLDKIDRNFYERFGDVQAFAYNRLAVEAVLADSSSKDLQDFLNTMTQYYVLYDLMLLCDLNGKVLAVNTKNKDGIEIGSSKLINKDLSQSDWFKACIASKGPEGGAWYSDFMFSEMVKSSNAANPLGWGMAFAAPIKNESGQVVGVWYNFANWQEVSRGIRESAEKSLEQKGAFVVITDKAGNIIDSHDSTLVTSQEKLNDKLESLLIDGKKINLSNYSIGKGEAKGAYTYKGKNWQAYTFIPKQKLGLTTFFTKELFGLVIFDLSCLAIALFLGFRFSKKLSGRVFIMKSALDELSKGKTTSIELEGNDQITDISSSINNLNKAMEQKSNFADAIGKRNFDINFAVSSENDLLGNALMQMRNSLVTYAEEEKRQTWAIEGLAKFAEILQKEQGSTDIFDKIISNVVKYVGANQAAIFLVKESQNEADSLYLKTCYAHNRKKYINKEIQLGEGLVGQCFLEGEEIYLTDVPKDYINITSGLGEATPRCVLVLPLKTNDKIVGIIEIASFSILEQYRIDFLKKLAENIAGTLAVLKNNETTQKLLHEAQMYSEMMRAQEEELRQNMEELHSTQEEVIRKQKLSEQQTKLLNVILDKIPFPVFVKDATSRYILANEAQAKLIDIELINLINKKDDDFISDIDELKLIHESDKNILNLQKAVKLPMQKFTLKNKETKLLQTHKIPFENPLTGESNILGISVEYNDKEQ